MSVMELFLNRLNFITQSGLVDKGKISSYKGLKKENYHFKVEYEKESLLTLK